MKGFVRKYSIALLATLLLAGGTITSSRVNGGTPTVVATPLKIGQVLKGSVSGTAAVNGTKDYSLSLSYGKDGLTSDVVVLFTANHYALVTVCTSSFLLPDGTSRGDNSCGGASGGI